ncbi:MAG: type II secretion system protein M [Gammaproteobacteria bacterium]|nr:type II secretion system protein M [Gammaproteobacteria bacterium]
MKRWFADLEPRERFFLIGGATAAAIIVVWGLIWNPMSTRTVELSDAVATKHRMLATLQRARAVAAPAGQAQLVDASTRQSLVLLIDQTHRSYGLDGTLVRNQPDGSDGIRVTFQDASFDGLVAWLGTLQGSYAVAVETATIDGGRQAGIVNATFVLRRS